MPSSVEATDETQLYVTWILRTLRSWKVSHHPLSALKPTMSQIRDSFATNPIGSGAYKFVSRTTGSNIVLTANEDYYRGAPEIKDITFEVIPNTATKAISLQTGEVDFAEIIFPYCRSWKQTRPSPSQKFRLPVLLDDSMNTEKEPFNDVKVRQAINYAIDRDNLVAVCYDGKAEVNSNLCAKHRFGYSDDQPQYTYDPGKRQKNFWQKQASRLLMTLESCW